MIARGVGGLFDSRRLHVEAARKKGKKTIPQAHVPVLCRHHRRRSPQTASHFPPVAALAAALRWRLASSMISFAAWRTSPSVVCRPVLSRRVPIA